MTMQEKKIKFQDLTRLHASIQAELNDCFQTALASSAFIQGAPVARFEKEFQEFTGSSHALGVANGTDALELALEALGIGRGDLVLTPSMTFAATAEAIVRQGATPIFVEVDPNTLCVTVETLAEALACTHGKVKAVIAVHLYGRACEISEIQKFCEKHGLALIEDSAQAHGARHQGRHVGNFGKVATYSFYPGKNLGALGDGGAITTNDAKLAERLRLLRDHGRVGKYDHQIVGRNSRLDALQASFLSVKLRHLAGWNAKRRILANSYAKALAGLEGLELVGNRGEILEIDDQSHVYHLLVVRIKTRSREAFMKAMAERGIETLIHYPAPLHKNKAFEAYPPRVSLAKTEQACTEIVSLPMDPLMELTDVTRVCEAIRSYLKG